MENEIIFKYINPNQNDSFSKISGQELREIIYYLKDYYLELRSSIGLPQTVTFGLELEFEKAKKEAIESILEREGLIDIWDIKTDASLYHGAEINSPVLTDKRENWQELETVCAAIKKHAIIGENSGGHIHIGTHTLGTKKSSWINFLKLWSTYENIIFRFAYGEKNTPRKSIIKYAKPISEELWKCADEFKTLRNIEEVYLRQISYTLTRRSAVNFLNVYDFEDRRAHNTIEFRCPNGTLAPVIWQNNVLLFTHLLKYASSDRYNDDIVEKRKQENNGIYDYIDWYGEIYLDQVLELSDMLFTNNLDKLYFLRQYLKNLDSSPKTNSKSFIKTK